MPAADGHNSVWAKRKLAPNTHKMSENSPVGLVVDPHDGYECSLCLEVALTIGIHIVRTGSSLPELGGHKSVWARHDHGQQHLISCGIDCISCSCTMDDS